MSRDDTPEAGVGSVISGLLAPLRLPERVIGALESLADAAGDLAAIRSELRRVREQTAPLAELLPALAQIETALGARIDSLRGVVVALESDESYLNSTVKELVGELAAMHKTLHGLQDDVQRVTDRLPDQDEKRGALKTARDVLTGGSE